MIQTTTINFLLILLLTVTIHQSSSQEASVDLSPSVSDQESVQLSPITNNEATNDGLTNNRVSSLNMEDVAQTLGMISSAGYDNEFSGKSQGEPLTSFQESEPVELSPAADGNLGYFMESNDLGIGKSNEADVNLGEAQVDLGEAKVDLGDSMQSEPLEGKSESSEGKIEFSEVNLSESEASDGLEGKSDSALEDASVEVNSGESLKSDEQSQAEGESLEGKKLPVPVKAKPSPPSLPYLTQSPCCPVCCTTVEIKKIVKCCSQQVPVINYQDPAFGNIGKILLTPFTMPIAVGLKAAKFGASIPASVGGKGTVLSAAIGGPIIVGSVAVPPLTSGAVSTLFAIPAHLWSAAEDRFPIVDVSRRK